MELQEGALLDVYLSLLAIGWIDGHLDEPERVLILRAAERDGLSVDELARLEEAARWPVSFEDLVPSMGASERRYVYTMGSLIARLDGVVDPVEDAALDAFSEVLGIGAADRKQLDELAQRRVLLGEDLAQFEPVSLRAEIRDLLGR